METTIIDSDNYSASGIETFFFPGGEPHVKLPQFKDQVLFFGKLRNWNDVGLAALVIDGLHRQCCFSIPFIPYFPGARQDRSDGSCGFTLSVMLNTLHRWQESYLRVFDAHSSVMLNRGNSVKSFDWTDLEFPKRDNVVGIIAPDKGALERAHAFAAKFYPSADVFHGSKNRDPSTGKLSNYSIPELNKIGHYIIVDDICDGGGTFNLLIEAIKKDAYLMYGAPTFELVVSHGIFSKGLDAIDPMITKITTTNSWCQLPESDRLTVIKLEQLFPKIFGE